MNMINYENICRASRKKLNNFDSLNKPWIVRNLNMNNSSGQLYHSALYLPRHLEGKKKLKLLDCSFCDKFTSSFAKYLQEVMLAMPFEKQRQKERYY